MKILLAIDDSKYSEAALQMVINQNRPETTEVRVLHILEPMAALSLSTDPAAFPNWDRLQKELADRADAIVGKATEQLRARAFKVDALVREGMPRVDIVDFAAEWG